MEASRTHQSLKRGLRMIEVIAAIGGPSTLAEVTRKTGLSRSTAHHILGALVEFGYLAKDTNKRTYTLAPKLFRLTEPRWTEEQLAEIAKPFLEKLRHLTGEGTSLAVIRDGVVTIIAKCESEGPVRVVQEVGVTRRIHCTAVGKLLAAWLPDKELDHIINRTKFEQMTVATITSPTKFRHELMKIRESGFAMDNEEHIKGIRCIATAVRDHSGEVRAALCVVGTKDNLTHEKMKEIHMALADISSDLSVQLGYESEDETG